MTIIPSNQKIKRLLSSLNQKVNEAHEVHINLTELKKSCDSMKITGLTRDKDIEKMRKEIDQMTI